MTASLWLLWWCHEGSYTLKLSHNLPVKMTAFLVEVPQASIKWTASPHRSEGWPVNTTQGDWYTLPSSPVHMCEYDTTKQDLASFSGSCMWAKSLRTRPKSGKEVLCDLVEIRKCFCHKYFSWNVGKSSPISSYMAAFV